MYLKISLSIFALIMTLSGCQQAEKGKVLRVGHTLDTSHSVHIALEHMANRLHHYSNGTMSLNIYPNGSLGSEREMVELLQIGSLAMTKVSAATLEGFVNDMKLFGLPYVFRSRGHRWQVLSGNVGTQILKSTEQSNLVGLGYMDAGSRSFYTCNAQVNKPDDIAGKKIRVMSSQNAVNMVNAYGGSPTPLSWGELYAALQQGVVDGAENNPPSFYSSRHYEVCKYYTLNEHTSIPDVVVASQHIYQSLNNQQQKWLSRAMNDAVNMQKKLWFQAEQDALTAVKAAGVSIVYPEKQPFMNLVMALHEPFNGTKIGEYLQQIKQVSSDEK